MGRMKDLNTDASLAPFLDDILAKLALLLTSNSKNPPKPNFNHYLFKNFSVLIEALCVKNRGFIIKFEVYLFPIFIYVLDQEKAATTIVVQKL